MKDIIKNLNISTSIFIDHFDYEYGDRYNKLYFRFRESITIYYPRSISFRMHDIVLERITIPIKSKIKDIYK